MGTKEERDRAKAKLKARNVGLRVETGDSETWLIGKEGEVEERVEIIDASQSAQESGYAELVNKLDTAQAERDTGE